MTQFKKRGAAHFGQVNEDLVRKTQVTISSAELLALNATPKTLIAAPGAGKYIVVEEITALNNHGGTDYSFDADMTIRYTDGSGDELTNAFPEVAFCEASADAVQKVTGIDCIPVACARFSLGIHSANFGTALG